MNTNISKSVKYLIGLCVAGLLACGIYVSLAYANVCFLPSGLCDFNESNQYEYVIPSPPGECTGNIEEDKSKCCLLSPLPFFKCEQCNNGRYKCEEQCINNDYQLITNRGTHQSECVCKGDACGSLPNGTNNKDLRDKHCSVSLNSCGLCPDGKCVCNGEKCSDRNTGYKKFGCSTSKTNNCGNCPTDRNASCECVNCCEDIEPKGDYYSNSDRKCKDIGHTKDGSTCYRPYNCTCPEQFQDSQAGNICPDAANQVADFISNAENGDACYKCRNKGCSDYSDEHTTYHDSYSDRNKSCQDYSTVPFNNVTCYLYNNYSCETLFGNDSAYSGVTLFISEKELTSNLTDCYSFETNDSCSDFVGTCHLGRKKSCSERNLLSSRPAGKICTEVKTCDTTCYKDCHDPLPTCVGNGGTLEGEPFSCPASCTRVETYAGDEGKKCYFCDPCDLCKIINSNYRQSSTDPCEGGTCCRNGGWRQVKPADANGRTDCYKCTPCSEIDANYQVGQVANCKTTNKALQNAHNCYTCPTCFQYGVDKGAYESNINQSNYPAYQENQCAADKIQVEVPDTNKCYQCQPCSTVNSQWQSGSSCTDGKTAKTVLSHTQCKKCVKCPDNTWTTTKPSSGEYSTWTDEDTGFTCYKSGTCNDYSQYESSSSCDSNTCYKATEHDHAGRKCYTCETPRTCEELYENDSTYNSRQGYVFYDRDITGVGNLTCTKLTKCDRDCWACKEDEIDDGEEDTCPATWSMTASNNRDIEIWKRVPVGLYSAVCGGLDGARWQCSQSSKNKLASNLGCTDASTLRLHALDTSAYQDAYGERCVYSYCLKDCSEIGAFDKGDYFQDADNFHLREDEEIEEGVRLCEFQEVDIPGTENCFQCGSCAEATRQGLCGDRTCVEENESCQAGYEKFPVSSQKLGGLVCKQCIRTCESAGYYPLGHHCGNLIVQKIQVAGNICVTCVSQGSSSGGSGGGGCNLCGGHGYLTTELDTSSLNFPESDQDLRGEGWQTTPCLGESSNRMQVYYKCSNVDGDGHVTDVYCNASSPGKCEGCCIKEIGPSGERIVMKHDADSSCIGVCNEANCCYSASGKPFDPVTASALCSSDAMANSGTCNPMDDGSTDPYFKCPAGLECIPDVGASSTDGHCENPFGCDEPKVTCSPSGNQVCTIGDCPEWP